MIATNNEIADSIDVKIDLNQALFPNYDTPDDIKEIYEKIEKDLVVEK
jgi:hypothetical protein